MQGYSKLVFAGFRFRVSSVKLFSFSAVWCLESGWPGAREMKRRGLICIQLKGTSLASRGQALDAGGVAIIGYEQQEN